MNDKPPPTQRRFYPLLERHQAIMEGSGSGLFPREIGQDLDVRQNMQGGQDLDSWSWEYAMLEPEKDILFLLLHCLRPDLPTDG